MAERFYFIKYLFTPKKCLADFIQMNNSYQKTIICFGNCHFYNNYP